MKQAPRRKTRSRIFDLARPRGRRSRQAARRAGATPAVQAGKTSPVSPSWLAQTSSRLDRARASLIIALVACATLPYLNILFNGFVYDDEGQVMENPYVRSFHYLKEIFTTNVWSFTGVIVTNYYRPMMTLGYIFCYRLFGMQAYGFHLFSLLIHVLVVCLLFVLTERLTGDRVCAFVAAGLFALHPVHTESVAWIAAVTDLEVTFFYLLTFTLFLAVARPEGRRSIRTLAAMAFAFILALLSKEQAMTLPALATAYEHFYREDRCETSASQKLARYGALWLVGLAYLLFRIHFLGGLAPQVRNPQVTQIQIVLSAVALVGQYVWKILWPVRLCAFYVFSPNTSPFDLSVLAGMAAFLALATLFFVCWRSRERNTRFASFAILWFIVTLAPTLNAHWVGYNVFTERYLYLPSVGVAWLAGLAASSLWRRAASRPPQRRALALAGVALCGLFAARIVIRDRDWNNDLTLYNRTLELSPNAGIILNLLGRVYWNQGAVDQAESAWRRALAANPDDSEALNNLGVLASQRHQYPQAVEYFQHAIKLRPSEPDPHLGLGKTYANMGMPLLAEPQLRAAVALSPLDTGARNALGRLLFVQGRLDEAEDQFRASLGIAPNAFAYDFLGMFSIRQGAVGEAESDFQAALSLDESDSNAHFGLGYIYQTAGRTAEALSQYQAGLVKDPTNSPALAAVQKLQQQIAGAAP